MFAKGRIRAKAAETLGLFDFFVEVVLPKFGKSIPRGDASLECARALSAWLVLLQRLPDVPSDEECEELNGLCARHLTLLEPAGASYKPKHHLLWHLSTRTAAGITEHGSDEELEEDEEEEDEAEEEDEEEAE